MSAASANELFNTLFTFPRTLRPTHDLEPVLQEVEIGDKTASPPYAINIEMQEERDGPLWTIATQAGFFDSETIDELFETLDDILEYLVDDKNDNVFEEHDTPRPGSPVTPNGVNGDRYSPPSKRLLTSSDKWAALGDRDKGASVGVWIKTRVGLGG